MAMTLAAPVAVAAAVARRETSVRSRFLRSRRAVGGLAVLVVVLLLTSALSLVWPGDPTALSPANKLLPPLVADRNGVTHLMGTDILGRDILTRVLFGARVSLAVAIGSVVVAGAIGLALGLVAGFYSRLDAAIMRIADIQLAIPTVLLAIGLAAAVGPSLPNLIFVLAITNWVIFARTVRASSLSLRESLFVEAARCAGADDLRILGQHILRNAWTPIIVVASQRVAQMILLEASLSFLGVGVPVDVATWGSMVADGRAQILTNNWWVAGFPGLAITLTVLGVNFFGDGLRDVLDPRLRL
ncbi:MAG TPA: ABC transporter permease [Chloroflexota bacterium]|nr:ABC transporter permease [Chloroflexota bacterium]